MKGFPIFIAEKLKHSELLLPAIMLLFMPVLTYYSISLFSKESALRVSGFLVAFLVGIILVYLFGIFGTYILLAINSILLIIVIVELIIKLEK